MGRGAIINSSRGVIYAPPQPRRGLLPSRQTRRHRTPGRHQHHSGTRGKGLVLELHLGDELLLKRTHPCGNDRWSVERLRRRHRDTLHQVRPQRHGGKDPLGAPGASGRAPA